MESKTHFVSLPSSASLSDKCVSTIVANCSKNTHLSTSSVTSGRHLLQGKWNMYFHLPVDKDNRWTLDSYQEIMFQMTEAEQVIAVLRGLKENVVKYGLLFVMRTPISPIWEDPKNRGMGAFSYKVSNRSVCDVWRNLCYAMCGESLCVQNADSHHVNGLSISPKKGFCCIKIWMDTLEFQDPSIFVDIPGLSRTGCLFRKHDA
jgi:hypothetical protein